MQRKRKLQSFKRNFSLNILIKAELRNKFGFYYLHPLNYSGKCEVFLIGYKSLRFTTKYPRKIKLEIHPKATNDLIVCEIMTGATKLGSFSAAIANISLKNGKGVKSAMTLIGIYCEIVSPRTNTKMNLNMKINM